jgi:hypothetical protein
MARMLRHISGKRDFDLFAVPETEERLFTKSQLKQILGDFSAAQLSPQVQSQLSQQDMPMHFYDVALNALFEAVHSHGYSHPRLEDAVIEVLSHRNDYQHDVDMQEWMQQNLVHVKYDFAGDGALQVGQKAPLDDHCIASLDTLHPRTLRDLMSCNQKPLVLLAGSWS